MWISKCIISLDRTFILTTKELTIYVFTSTITIWDYNDIKYNNASEILSKYMHNAIWILKTIKTSSNINHFPPIHTKWHNFMWCTFAKANHSCISRWGIFALLYDGFCIVKHYDHGDQIPKDTFIIQSNPHSSIYLPYILFCFLWKDWTNTLSCSRNCMPLNVSWYKITARLAILFFFGLWDYLNYWCTWYTKFSCIHI